MKTLLLILPALIVAGFLLAKPVEATFEFNPCQYIPQLCASPSPSASPSLSPEPTPSVEPSPSLLPCGEVSLIALDNPCPSEEPSSTPSASPSEEPRPGLTNPGPGGTSGSDGHCTYDPNRSACGGKDPVVPSAPPKTGFGQG